LRSVIGIWTVHDLLKLGIHLRDKSLSELSLFEVESDDLADRETFRDLGSSGTGAFVIVSIKEVDEQEELFLDR
jgi:hypothetical protein